jgi:SsrA-binding protein
VSKNPAQRPPGPSKAKGPTSRTPDLARRLIASNRRGRHDYLIEKTIEAGLALVGSEVKSLRGGSASLAEAYAHFENGELWLERMHIPPLPQASYQNHDPLRKRKCLVHKREAAKLEGLLAQGHRTLVPLSLYFLGHRIKVELGVGLSRTKGDRREIEKEKEARKQIRDVEGRVRGRRE